MIFLICGQPITPNFDVCALSGHHLVQLSVVSVSELQLLSHVHVLQLGVAQLHRVHLELLALLGLFALAPLVPLDLLRFGVEGVERVGRESAAPPLSD